MAFALSPRLASRVRTAGMAVVLLVLATAPLERWYLTRRSNALYERLLDVRAAATTRHPAGWQADSGAVAQVADLEYRRAQVRHRLVAQWTLEGWTVRLLLLGAGLVLVGVLGEKGEGRAARRVT